MLDSDMRAHAQKRIESEIALMVGKLDQDAKVARSRLANRGAVHSGAALDAIGSLVTEFQKRRARVALRWLLKAVPRPPEECGEDTRRELSELIGRYASVESAERKLRDMTVNLHKCDVDKDVCNRVGAWGQAVSAAQSEADLFVLGRARKAGTSVPAAPRHSLLSSPLGTGVAGGLIATAIVWGLTWAFRRALAGGVPQELLIRLCLSAVYASVGWWLVHQMLGVVRARGRSAARTWQFLARAIALVALAALAIWAWQPN